MENNVYRKRVKNQKYKGKIFLKMFTFWEAEVFSVLFFSLGLKGGDLSLIFGGSSWYSAGMKQDFI